MQKLSEDTIRVSGKDIPVTVCLIPHSELSFYPENPRIYSITCVDGKKPTQAEIEKKLIEMDHVSKLIQSIKANDGLTDPIVVRDGDYVVLEGNSRLAAYRELSQTNKIKWGNIKCYLLPQDTKESLIFALLGQYHLVGKKDWAPYEQAGFLWRRQTNHGLTSEQLAAEMGMAKGEVKKLITVYEFMAKHGDSDVQHWSHYDEYLKSRNIKNARAEYDGFDEYVVGKIKSGEISVANYDVRDKLDKISAAGERVVRRFLDGKMEFEDAYQAAIAKGLDNSIYKRLHKMREEISDPDYKQEILSMVDEQRDKCIFELEKIEKNVVKLVKEMKASRIEE